MLERLRWWDGYFNEGEPDKFKNPHPLFRDEPAGFDESAIERDVADAIADIKRLTTERNVWERCSLEEGLRAERLEVELRRYTDAEPVEWQYHHPVTCVWNMCARRESAGWTLEQCKASGFLIRALIVVPETPTTASDSTTPVEETEE